MARNAARPLSPHLTIWKWGPHMLVSILHRATGKKDGIVICNQNGRNHGTLRNADCHTEPLD